MSFRPTDRSFGSADRSFRGKDMSIVPKRVSGGTEDVSIGTKGVAFIAMDTFNGARGLRFGRLRRPGRRECGDKERGRAHCTPPGRYYLLLGVVAVGAGVPASGRGAAGGTTVGLVRLRGGRV